MQRFRTSVVLCGFVALCLAVVLIERGVADGGADHQAQQNAPIELGSTGGNVNDVTRRFCCSGTLGALVEDASTQYVLSNSHVIALSGNGSVGQDISHPGLIDANCQVLNVVADLSAWVPFANSGNCCDAAIAEVRSGQVSSSILDIGVPCASTVSASVGMTVQKSGRSTGHTTGTVAAVGVTINVIYPKKCGGSGGPSENFTNQIAIGPGAFSGGGDSGSVIFDSGKHAVGLLFAGSATTTFANPIDSVLSSLGVSMVGNNCFDGHQNEPPYSQDELMGALSVLEERSEKILRKPWIVGHGVGLSKDGEIALKIFVEKLGARANGRTEFEGYPVEYVDLGGPVYFNCGTHPME